MAIKLYKLDWLIELGQAGEGWVNNNMPTSQSDFIIFKGAMNKIDFVVRNTDRKPIDLTNRTLNMTVIDRISGETVIHKKLLVVDAVQGKVLAIFNPYDFMELPVTSYRYSITMVNEYGHTEFLFQNQFQQASGFLEIRADTIPVITEATVIDMDLKKLTPFGYYVDGWATETKKWWFTSPYAVGDGITTIAVYVENFYGKFWVEGNINDNCSNDNDWFTINLDTKEEHFLFNGKSGIESFNFKEKMKWIRFKVEPNDLKNGTIFNHIDGNREGSTGKMVQILLRT